MLLNADRAVVLFARWIAQTYIMGRYGDDSHERRCHFLRYFSGPASQQKLGLSCFLGYKDIKISSQLITVTFYYQC